MVRALHLVFSSLNTGSTKAIAVDFPKLMHGVEIPFVVVAKFVDSHKLLIIFPFHVTICENGSV